MKKWGEGAAAKGKKPSETEEADREAQRHHTPQAPSPIPEREFRRALLKEPLEDWEYAIPLEKPNGQEIKGVEDREMVETPGGETQGLPAPQHPQPKALAKRQIRGVKVLLRKIPPQV